MYIAIAPKDVFAAVGSACRRPAPLQRLDLETRSSKRFSKAIVFEARYGGFGAQKSRTARPPRGCPEPSRLEGHVTAVSLIKICFRIVAAGCIIRKIPEAVEDGVLDRRLLWFIGRQSMWLVKWTSPARAN